MITISKPDSRKWARLKFTNTQGLMAVEYEDGYGKVMTGKGVPYPDESGRFFSPMSREVIERVVELSNIEPLRRSVRGGSKKIPLAIFVDLDDLEPWSVNDLRDRQYFLRDMFRGVLDEEDYRMIVNAQVEDRPAFSLPYRIRYIGRDGSDLEQSIRQSNWFYGMEQIGQPALSIEPVNEGEILLAEEPVSVLIVYPDGQYGLDPERLPDARLTIILDARILDYRKLPRNRSFLVVDAFYYHENNRYLEAFIYAIIHDMPLHEADKEASARVGAGHYPFPMTTTLFTSPTGNQSLRMTDALESFRDKLFEQTRKGNAGNFEQFAQKFSQEHQQGFLAEMKRAYTASLPQDYVRDVNAYIRNFDGESSGLVPLARKMDEYTTQYHHGLEAMHQNLFSLVNNNAIFDEIRKRQERKVDVTLESCNESLFYVPLPPGVPLQLGGRYRLNVTIGQRSPNSLIKGDIDAIDPLLPDPEGAEGHLLDVVVFEKDFLLESPRSVTIRLPLLEGSEKAQFIIVAPRDTDKAELRIGIFHKNNLLQAFLLSAEIGWRTQAGEYDPVIVTMDLATSEKFTNMDAIEPRDLYIGMNRDITGNHSLFIKTQGGAEQRKVQVDELNNDIINKAQVNFGNMLDSGLFNANRSPRFSSLNEPGVELTKEFAETLAQFARFGYDHYMNLLQSQDNNLEAALDQITGGSDLAIQIGQHDLNYSFPWSVIYDYNMPGKKAGEEDIQVCTGTEFSPEVRAKYKAPRYGCPHNPDTKCVCIYGFWGVRHRIENIIASGGRGDVTPADTSVRVGSDVARPMLFCINSIDEHTTELIKTFDSYNPPIRTLDCNSNLMDILWDDALRPPVLVALGHMDTTDIQGEPEGKRILTNPRDNWPEGTAIPEEKFIYRGMLNNYYKEKRRWKEPPSSIVLLMNCSSGQMRMDTVTSIVGGFKSAGASAVVATECNITAALATRFVKKFLKAMCSEQKELGEALREFNEELILSGNPLPFVFVVYGNTNLKL